MISSRIRRIGAIFALAGLVAATLGFPGAASAGLGNPRTAYLTAPVAIPASGYADGPTVQIGNATNATTWVVSGGVVTDYGATCRLWDGTTIVASGHAGNGETLALTGYLDEPPGTPILKISCTDPGAGDAIEASDGASAGNGTTISWVTAAKVG